MEAWSALKCPGRWLRWLWISENTVDQHQQITWQPKSSMTVKISHWTSSNMDYVPLHSSSRLWDLDFQMKCKIYFHLKRGLWTTGEKSSSCSPYPRYDASDDVAVSEVAWLPFSWRYLSVGTLDALTPASVHSLWSSPKCLNRLCLTVFLSLWSFLLLLHIFLSNFFLPVNFAFNMLWYSTPWTDTPLRNDPLWLTLFVGGVNDRLLDHCQVSSVLHYCGFKEQEIPWIYTVVREGEAGFRCGYSGGFIGQQMNKTGEECFHGQLEWSRILCHADESIATAGRAVTAAEAMKPARLLANPSERLSSPQRAHR